VSYCQVLKQNNKNKEKTQRVIVFHNKDSFLASTAAVKNPKNQGFAALGLLDEESDKMDAQELAEYPALIHARVQAQTPVQVKAPIMSYASMANKAPSGEHKTPPAVTKSRAIVTHNVKRSWADWSDSDNESDCECGHCDF
jgi:type IV secretory pathway VirB10-like protein